MELIQSKLLQNINHIKHGFFTRKGGVSTGIYQSLNFGFGSNDNPKHIKQNYHLAAKYLNIANQNIITPYQIHSNKVVILDKHKKLLSKHYKADALITNLPNIAISILTADCLPILLYAKDIKYIAAIHAGWKGAFSGIIENTISKLSNLGSNTNHVICSIMPSICQQSYQIDQNFYNKFITHNHRNSKYFIPSNQNHFLFDLRQYAIDKLQQLNITNIDNIATDTYSNQELCFSYRRSTHLNQPDMGRHLSFILLQTN